MTAEQLKIEMDLPEVVLTVRIGGGEPIDLDPYEMNDEMAVIEAGSRSIEAGGGIAADETRWVMFATWLGQRLSLASGELRMSQVHECFAMAKAIIEAEAEAVKKKTDATRSWLLSIRGFPPAGSNGQSYASDDGTLRFRVSSPSEPIARPSSDTTHPIEPIIQSCSEPDAKATLPGFDKTS